MLGCRPVSAGGLQLGTTQPILVDSSGSQRAWLTAVETCSQMVLRLGGNPRKTVCRHALPSIALGSFSLSQEVHMGELRREGPRVPRSQLGLYVVGGCTCLPRTTVSLVDLGYLVPAWIHRACLFHG